MIYRFCKRGIDIAVASVALVLLAPVLVLAAMAVYAMLGRPVLFRQARPGLGARPFVLYKFRTMTDQRGPDGRLLADHLRLGRFGRFLRSWSLDELPQLWNVLVGDMSLVGPRPLLTQYLARYTPRQARRHEARPGITGWAQIHGRNAITWEEKFALDVWYVEHRSLRLDLKIILASLWKVAARDGIRAPDHATMPEFFGPEMGIRD
jgi:lipopolysaccharide/colanic/teichoic acid biosynthesis glycosyltransferase